MKKLFSILLVSLFLLGFGFVGAEVDKPALNSEADFDMKGEIPGEGLLHEDISEMSLLAWGEDLEPWGEHEIDWESFESSFGGDFDDEIFGIYPGPGGAEIDPFGGFASGFASGFAGGFMLVIVLVILLGLYIYTSIVYMCLARKTGESPAWLAWIPVANIYLWAKIARVHWWPIVFVLLPVLTVLLIIVGVYSLTLVALSWLGVIVWVFVSFFWHIKIFDRVGRPEWWALSLFLPGMGSILFLIFLGMAAWGKSVTKSAQNSDQDAGFGSQTPVRGPETGPQA